ncbi:DUF354 domain-containing protein [Saccharicrinis sp. FJH54]|uniref:DUF354 domain-containing protein n=1 Tax=Saccharicrinis sp. FJH54 TaxID=3344665 RepID=UPI0035D501E3
MKIAFYLGHPAHFHLFKNVIKSLSATHDTTILIKKKDILEKLLEEAGLTYINILSEGRKDSKTGLLVGMIKRSWRLFRFYKKLKPDLLVGTSVENSFMTKILGIPSINVNEDDAEVVPLYAKLSYPWASVILNPSSCNSGKWDEKAIKYSGYQELAYLHPNHFTPQKKVVEKYFPVTDTYFIMRFAKLTAHHDKGIKGLNAELSKEIIKILEPHGKVYITSERELSPEFEPYRINIDTLDMHDVISFASLYIGDSQTMAAEAGVLGIPFIRFNDFVGRIGYLKELENTYQLGFGYLPTQSDQLLNRITDLLNDDKLKHFNQNSRMLMLKDKIDLHLFLTWFIENYPQSVKIMKENPDYQNRFK